MTRNYDVAVIDALNNAIRHEISSTIRSRCAYVSVKDVLNPLQSIIPCGGGVLPEGK